MTTRDLIELRQRADLTPPLPQLPSPAEARAIREASGMSQSTVAMVLGVNVKSVARWELGQNRPQQLVERSYRRVLAALQADAPQAA